jgi:hypothetical protein
MKNLKKPSAGWSLALITIAFSLTVQAQNLDKARVQNLIQSKEFVFKAQTVIPMTGDLRQLTTDYEVKLLGDSIVSYLPYFGRAYTAVYGSESGGIDFTSTRFDYKVKARKKGGWDISVKPKDAKEIQELDFSISVNGSASLRVNSTNRQPISFFGNIVERK